MLASKLRLFFTSSLCLVLSGVFFSIYTAICIFAGANAVHMLSFFFCIIIYLLLPGMALAQLFAPHGLGLSPLLTLLYGLGFFAVLTCLSVRLQLPVLLSIVPPLLAACLFRRWLPYAKAAPACFRQNPLYGAFLLFWSVLCVLFALLHSAPNAHPISAGAIDLSQDLLWNVGNGYAFTQAFPPEDIRFDGVRFSYHYLTELLAGGLSLVSHASAYDIFVFFAGPVYLAAQLVALYCLGRCFYCNSRKKSAALPFILIGFQCAGLWAVAQGRSPFGNTLLSHIISNINAQATALIFLCITTVLFATLSRLHFRADIRLWLAYFSSFFMLCFAKGPQAAIFTCSLIITMLIVIIFQKPAVPYALLCLFVSSALFFSIYWLLFSAGANSSITFSPVTIESTPVYPMISEIFYLLPFSFPRTLLLCVVAIVNTFCFLPFQMTLWLYSLGHSVRRFFQLDAAHLLANGIVVGGFLAYYLFWHPHSSQIYFALIAAIYATLLSVEQLSHLITPHKRLLKTAAFFSGTVALCTTAVMCTAYFTQGLEQLIRILGLAQPTAVSARAVLADDERAMQWLSANTPNDIVFATNRTSSQPDRNDGISAVYSAFGCRQAYLEGWTYAASNMGIADAVIQRRQAVNRLLFDPQTPKHTIFALCAQEGIDFLILSNRYNGAVNPDLIPQYQNASVSIYDVRTVDS